MKVVFFTFYYPPDLCAGSFRAAALVKALTKKLSDNDQLHVITTHPNRYASHRIEAKDIEVNGNITIHRIAVPRHQSGMISQTRTFGVFAFTAFRLCRKLKPDFLVGTTSRLMTGVLTGLSARLMNRNYYIDLRDIFSETISDILARKNKFLGAIVKSVFTFIEKSVFNNAAGVSIVSKGFPDYFQKNSIDTSCWSFFPNGVDQEFINFSSINENTFRPVKTILYAGNIGSGQGLEIIIPALAKRLGSSYRFDIIGDGSTMPLLKAAIKREGATNIELHPPVSRVELLEYYKSADVLFLHLNNLPAFTRVLPSKIFEYAALGKPILAGVSGYPADFLKSEVKNAVTFEPCNVSSAMSAFELLNLKDEIRTEFILKFSRENIMKSMADDVFLKIKK